MISEEQVVSFILDLESKHDPEDEASYLDESDQAELCAYYTVLDRDLTSDEERRLGALRDEMINGGSL